MPQYSKKVILAIIAGLVAIVILIALIFSNSQPRDDGDAAAVISSDSDSSTAPVAVTDEEQLHFELLEQVDATVTQQSVDELIADLPANINLDTTTLFIVNPFQLVTAELDVEMITDEAGHTYASEAVEPYAALEAGALAAGYTLQTISAYRSMETQQYYRENMESAYIDMGMTQEEAVSEMDKVLAPTKGSEHLTGLAFDFVDSEWHALGNGLTEDYAGQASAQWLLANAADYGFILRYPEGKRHFTGYTFEPWHYRYVGVDAAQYIHEHGLTLEEFHLLVNERERRETGALSEKALAVVSDMTASYSYGEEDDSETSAILESEAESQF